MRLKMNVGLGSSWQQVVMSHSMSCRSCQ